MVEMSMGGMSLMKQVVNDKSGYVMQQGQKQTIEGDDLKEMQESAKPFDELTLASKTDVTLTGIETVDGNDAYVVKSGNTTYYYDVKTGLKLAQSKEEEQNGQKMTQTAEGIKSGQAVHELAGKLGVEMPITAAVVAVLAGKLSVDQLGPVLLSRELKPEGDY